MTLIYRLWDFDRDENYLLELSSVGQVPQTAHVTYIDYNKTKGKVVLLCTINTTLGYRYTQRSNQFWSCCHVAVLSLQE